MESSSDSFAAGIAHALGFSLQKNAYKKRVQLFVMDCSPLCFSACLLEYL
jgi:hypothetical protein